MLPLKNDDSIGRYKIRHLKFNYLNRSIVEVLPLKIDDSIGM